MENLFIAEPKGKDTPQIDFNAETCILEISGKSYPENAQEFFKPALDWLNELTASTDKKIILNFKMNYFNTGSSRNFFEMIGILEDYYRIQQKEALVNWYFEKDDKDMLEYGEDFADDADLPFNFIAYEV